MEKRNIIPGHAYKGLQASGNKAEPVLGILIAAGTSKEMRGFIFTWFFVYRANREWDTHRWDLAVPRSQAWGATNITDLKEIKGPIPDPHKLIDHIFGDGLKGYQRDWLKPSGESYYDIY
jgi:hypothetical protein